MPNLEQWPQSSGVRAPILPKPGYGGKCLSRNPPSLPHLQQKREVRAPLNWREHGEGGVPEERPGIELEARRPLASAHERTITGAESPEAGVTSRPLLL